jgi:hypothetical protein
MSGTTATPFTAPSNPAIAAAAGLGASYSPATVQRMNATIEAAQAQKDAATKPVYDDMQRNVAKDRLDFDKTADNFKPVEQTPPPKIPETDPLKAFGSVAGIFSVLAAGLSHTPALNAMNGLAAAVNGQKQNDWQSYEAGYKQWKENTELAIQNHKLQSDDMRLAMDRMQTDISGGTAMAKALSARSDDLIAARQLEMGNLENLAKLQDERARTGAALQEAAIRVQQWHQQQAEAAPLMIATKGLTDAMKSGDPDAIAKAREDYTFIKTGTRGLGGNTPQGIALQRYLLQYPQATAEDIQRFVTGFKPPSTSGAKEADAETLATAAFAKQHGHPPGPGDEAAMAELRTKQRAEGAGVINDDAAKLAADRILAGDESATVGMARSAGNMTKVMDALVAQNNARPHPMTGDELAAKIAEFSGMKAAERTLGTRSANMEVAANEVANMAPVALEASRNVDRSQYPTLNSLLLAYDRGTGDTNVVRAGLAANSLIYTYAKFLNPTGIPTDADKARATDILSLAWSQGQFDAGIDQIMRLEIPSGLGAIKATQQELRQNLTGQRDTGAASVVPKPSGLSDTQILTAARNGIAAGKPKQAIINQLRAWGVDVGGL